MSRPLAQSVAGLIRAEMARQGITTVTLAQRAGLTHRQLRRRLSSEVAPNVDELGSIAAALGVRLCQLIEPETGEGEEAA